MEILDASLTEDHIGIESEGQYLDLHNCYNFVKCEKQSDSVYLHWRKNDGDWVPKHIPSTVCMRFDLVDSFQQRGATSETLEELGFIDDADADYNPSHIYQPGDFLVFRFTHGGEILIKGKRFSVDLARRLTCS